MEAHGSGIFLKGYIAQWLRNYVFMMISGAQFKFHYYQRTKRAYYMNHPVKV